jgi:hypothetical protein
MTDIWTFPLEWYSFTSCKFQLKASSQTSPRPWAGGNSIYGPHAQLWTPKLTAEFQTSDVWPDMAAFFDRLGGQSGLMRMGDPSRVQCRYNASMLAAKQTFSDGTLYSDGTGNIDGLMPPFAFLISAANRGDTFVKIGGLLPTITAALRRNDHLEFRPNGIADNVPRLHSVMATGNTDSSGQVGIQIMPPLRQSLAAGDQVVLFNPTSVFHLIDDDQGEMEITPPMLANFGFSLFEAIEQA